MKSILKIFVVLVLFVGVPLSSCSGGDDDNNVVITDENFNATLDYSTVSSDPATLKLSITSKKDWTVTSDAASKNWLSPSVFKGSLSADLTLKVAQNTTADDRVAELKVSNGIKTITLKLLQQAEKPLPDTQGWLELPEISALSGTTEIIHHYMPDAPSKRNYTMLYNTRDKIAYWVAYPMHPSFMGGSGRTDAWNYDPEIPHEEQASLFWGIKGYDRGHQIPSADRTSSASVNQTTFYFTNMTPQLGTLNQGIWEKLESKVRDWTRQCDTLYVVTGAMPTVSQDDAVTYTYDNNNSKVAVPKYYFKALLKRKKNTFSSIAFKFNNAYPVFPNVSQYQMTVTDLEKLTGFRFFPKIDASVKEKIVDKDWK